MSKLLSIIRQDFKILYYTKKKSNLCEKSESPTSETAV